MTPEFKPFPKMPRMNRDCLILEKIDGTNASILIAEGTLFFEKTAIAGWTDAETGKDMLMFAGSRTRWITPQDDNHGFAAWVRDKADQLRELGPGHHFGEWWGSGIQRGYGLTKGEKRFSLFNAIRWVAGDDPISVASTSWNDKTRQMEPKLQERAPACCHVVPVLYRGPFSIHRADAEIVRLMDKGSQAAPGYMNPEGVVVFHIAGNVGFKKTIDNDDQPKGKS